MKILNKYKNGNAKITIWDDGTRETEYPDNEEINLDFPLSIDLCITKYCDRGCKFCYANCSNQGEHGDIMNLKFIDTIPAGVEISIGGGSATSHPDLKPFLKKIKEKGLIANMTVSQGEFIDQLPLINELIEDDLIHGLGISFKEENDQLWKLIAENENCVVHLIAGIHDEKVFNYLSQFGLKILILGYKDVGRGFYYHDALRKEIDDKINWLKSNLEGYLSKFKVVSFDNLAIIQLSPQGLVSKQKWDELFQGTDGSISCYIDAVKEEAHVSSLDERGFKLKNDIKDIFKEIKELKNSD